MKTGTIYNIIGVYHLADEIDKAEGLRAYDMYHETMRLFAVEYDAPLKMVVGIFAALSPINDYKGNLRSMKSVLEGRKHGLIKPEGLTVDINRIVVTTTGPNKAKALLIARGSDPVKQFATSDKVRNFYFNILDPQNDHAVTIDRHAISVWQGFRDKEGRVPDYERVANDYREAARTLKITPNALQGTTWFAWKRLHNIVFKDTKQGDLFGMAGNAWKSVTRPDEVSAFPFRKDGERSKYKSGAEKRSERSRSEILADHGHAELI